MKASSWAWSAVIALLVAGVFLAGCSDSNPSGDTAAQVTATTTAAASGPLYSTGDIVKNPKSSANVALLILGYDSGTDMYERALIYPNKDGSWGYRYDAKTEKISRASLEKTYSEKVGSIEVSAVPTHAPTTATTVPTTVRTTTATVATTTTSAADPPRVTDISPDKGDTGKTVSITELDGKNFQTSATVKLVKSGQTPIAATDVNVKSSLLITCKFPIPTDATSGFWDVVVTNPDGKSDTYENGFRVIENTTASSSSTSTSTTSTTKFTGFSPSPITLAGYGDTKEFTIMGVNLSSVITGVKLTKGSSVIQGSYIGSSSTEARAVFNIPTGSTGTWSVVLTDSGGNSVATLADGLVIN